MILVVLVPGRVVAPLTELHYPFNSLNLTLKSRRRPRLNIHEECLPQTLKSPEQDYPLDQIPVGDPLG